PSPSEYSSDDFEDFDDDIVEDSHVPDAVDEPVSSSVDQDLETRAHIYANLIHRVRSCPRVDQPADVDVRGSEGGDQVSPLVDAALRKLAARVRCTGKDKREKQDEMDVVDSSDPRTVPFPASIINRLRFQNLLASMEPRPFTEVTPSAPPQIDTAKLNELSWVNRKLDRLRRVRNACRAEEIIADGIERRLFLQTPALLIADIIREGPRPQDDPKVIWGKLLGRVYDKEAEA
ncbi:hypothetical protein HK104_005002, partial [Borealophlyctis nickersoniae]